MAELQMQVSRALFSSLSTARKMVKRCSDVQERKVGKRGGEENVGFEAGEGEDGSASGRREEEVAQMGSYGTIQV